MTALADKLRTEPAMVVAGILALATLLGVRFSQEQASALSQILTVLGPLIAGLIIRAQVIPVATVIEVVEVDEP